MKVVNMAKEVELSMGDITFVKFEEFQTYIMSDALHGKLARAAQHSLGFEIPFNEVYSKYEGQPLDDRKILLIRHGGGGDILFMLTAAKVLKKANPKCSINIAISKAYEAIPMNSPYIDNIHYMPISMDVWNEYHYQLTFEGVIEDNPEAMELNAYDLFMKRMGLDIQSIPPEEKIPELFLLQKEKDAVAWKVPSLRSPSKQIGIQIASSTSVRNYPSGNYIQIAERLIKKGYQVYFLGSLLQEAIIHTLVKAVGPGSFNCSAADLRASIVLTSFMDCIIAPDSMFIHIAGALRIPIIGIYTPFPSRLRMMYFKNAIGIDAEVGCSPCFMHGVSVCPKGDPSPCFSTISSDLIMEIFEKKIEEVVWKKSV